MKDKNSEDKTVENAPGPYPSRDEIKHYISHHWDKLIENTASMSVGLLGKTLHVICTDRMHVDHKLHIPLQDIRKFLYAERMNKGDRDKAVLERARKAQKVIKQARAKGKDTDRER